MPLLQYVCPECGKRFEELVQTSEIGEMVCPACGEKAQRAYQGKCTFGMLGSAKGSSGAACAGNCAGCAGCSHTA